MGKVIYITSWRAKRRELFAIRRLPAPEPAGMASVDLELIGETLDDYFSDLRPIDTLQESLLRQIEAGEVPRQPKS